MSRAIHNAWLDQVLQRRIKNGLLRQLEPLKATSAVCVQSGQRELLHFASNDYLGLSCHAEVKRAVAEAALQYGLGLRGSPLVCGYSPMHEALEAELAILTGHESALLFPSGYATNVGVITSFADEETTIFSDALNHASIIDACRLAKGSGAKISIYRHGDLNHLSTLLTECRSRRRIVITETVFSMEGDLAPLKEIAELTQRHDALLFTDEGHATLIMGERGAGLAEDLGMTHLVDVHIGTLSKAAAGLGGFAATSHKARQVLLNHARPFVFSSALPVPVVAGLRAALRIATSHPALRAKLHARIAELSAGIGVVSRSPIVPLILGDGQRAMQASFDLCEAGFLVRGIRPPTVPVGTSRLRITLCAMHQSEHITKLVDALDGLQLI